MADRMDRKKPQRARYAFAACINNSGYDASLERNKIYVVLQDENNGDLRVVDESGEDYWFSADRFVTIAVPARVKASLLRKHRRAGC